jgi:hypothetical protein
MGKTVHTLLEAGLRQSGFAGALARDADRLAVEFDREPASAEVCLMVRGFDGPRAVSAALPDAQAAAQSGVPVARPGQRAAGHIVRASENLGRPTLARVTPTFSGLTPVVVL